MARLHSVEHDTVHLRDVDLVNGTPIIDIKPYIPRFDSFAESEGVSWRATRCNCRLAP